MAQEQVRRAELRITRRYPASPEKVWRAWTEPQALSAWFGPGDTNSVVIAELDVRPGGKYRIRFRTPDGEEHEVGGVYEKCCLAAGSCSAGHGTARRNASRA